MEKREKPLGLGAAADCAILNKRGERKREGSR